MTRQFIMTALFSVALAIHSSIAYADTPANQRAEELYKRGNALYDQHRLYEAKAAYLEAWMLKKTYDIACNLGAVALDLNNPREAAEFLAYALHELPAGTKTALREQIEVRFARAKALVGTLRVRINVEGARLIVDRRVVPEKTEELFVDPGSHTLVAWREGYQEARSTLQASAGSSHEVSLTLTPLPGEKRAVWPIGVMGGVGGAALIAGIALMIDSKMKGGKADDLSTAIRSSGGGCAKGTPVYDPRCEELHSLAAAGDAENRAGIGLLVGAGAAAAGTLLYVLLPSSKTSLQSGLRVTPTVSISQAGFSFAGAF